MLNKYDQWWLHVNAYATLFKKNVRHYFPPPEAFLVDAMSAPFGAIN